MFWVQLWFLVTILEQRAKSQSTICYTVADWPDHGELKRVLRSPIPENASPSLKGCDTNMKALISLTV